ncbi:MAG: hypothetical protein ACI9CD_000155 [Candidatus Deianiraeaceae bacterium]|jgi:hypothetical protein
MKTQVKRKKSTKQKRMPILKDKEGMKNIVADHKGFASLFTKCLKVKKS